MFNKNKSKKSNSTRLDTLIGQHTEIKGDIAFSGGLRVDGSVTGNISATTDTKSVLTLSEESTVTGEINVPNLIINGTVSGNVYSSQHVELAPNAKIQGNLYYRLLEMAMGSEVNGQLIHVPEGDENLLSVSQDQTAKNEEALQLEQQDNLD